MTMTRGEATDFLEKCRYWFMPYTSEEDAWNEALDMAIEALEELIYLEKQIGGDGE